jgi:hypothetical protein
MTQSLSFTVEALLARQIELIGPAAVSVDSLWRASGCPSERDPRKWMELAAPLIAGSCRYLENIPASRLGEIAEGAKLLWVCNGEDSEPWRTGDVMTHELLARSYGSSLDSAA